MLKQKSVFLDFVRISAALIVLYGHAVLLFFGDIDNSPYLISNMRHFAVVLFFALSGYVIGFTTKSNNRGPEQYAIARLSRLCSMVIPALVVSFVIYLIISYITLGSFLLLNGSDFIRYLLASTFMNELWLISSAPRINGVLWSVSFEFFFYLIFGVYLFTKNKLRKIFYTCFVCLLAGPKIMLLFPIWIAGYLAFVHTDKFARFKNYYVFIVTIIATYFSYILIKPFPFLIGYKPFYHANQFVTDNISGILFALSLCVFPENNRISISPIFVNRFRKIADYTFPIYVLHYPILKLCKVLLMNKFDVYGQFYLSIFISIIISILLGNFFERYRELWSTLFKKIFRSKSVLVIREQILKL